MLDFTYVFNGLVVALAIVLATSILMIGRPPSSPVHQALRLCAAAVNFALCALFVWRWTSSDLGGWWLATVIITLVCGIMNLLLWWTHRTKEPAKPPLGRG